MNKVAIIGAGGAGLVTCKNLLSVGVNSTIFEIENTVGGCWSHGPMYDSLRTNLSKQVMSFTDYHFKNSVENFPDAKTVEEYLKDYSKNFNLEKHIKFNSKVTKIEFINNKWKVEINENTTELFDGVVDCSGHYSEPFIPNTPGLKEFKNLIHSKHYKEPSKFINQSVIVVGCGPSGSEIALEIFRNSNKDAKVYLSGENQFNSEFEIIPKPFIKKVNADGLIEFEDEKENCKVDWIILATGYQYTYPFIKSNLIKVIKKDVYPLYHHIFNCENPTLSFVGLNQRLLPFYVFDFQAKYIASVYSNRIQLPSNNEMKQQTDQYWKMKKEMIHTLGDEQWDYVEMIKKIIGENEKTDPLRRKVYDLVGVHRHMNFDTFRDICDEKVTKLYENEN